jgi:uncharacterized protein YsxB (DUF464 family)
VIRVKVLESRGTTVGYTVEGHAEFGPSGNDIVCAGVSAISQAALMVLQESLGARVRSERREGFLSVLLAEQDALQPGPAWALRTVVLGVESIAKVHPRSVEVSYTEAENR